MKKMFLVIGLFVLTNVVLHAQADIHGVDFKNFTYQPSCTDMEEGKKPENITVKKGEFAREKQLEGYVDRFYFEIRAVTYGDLTGDKAVFKVLRWTSGNFQMDFEGKTTKQTTQLNTQGLLMEGLKLLDEANRDSVDA